jgi:hypothetical protein
VEIASPFGGILYVVQEDADPDAIYHFCLTISRVSRYPFSVTGTDTWAESKAFATPWAEFVTQYAIFALATDVLVAVSDHQSFCNFIDTLVGLALAFLADESVRPYRVIFDVQHRPSPAPDGCPIVLSISQMDELFAKIRPTATLFTLLEEIAFRSLPTWGFPVDTRDALATLAAYVAFEDVWSEDDIGSYITHPKSSLFMTMIQICHGHPKSLFPEAMEFVRSKMGWPADTPDFYYNIFVRRIYETVEEDALGRDNRNSVEVQSDVAPSLLEFEIDATDDIILDD